MLGLYTLHTGFFYYTKAILMRRDYRSNAPTTVAAGRHHTGAFNNWGKTKIGKSIRHLKWYDKKVRWRCASYKINLQANPTKKIKEMNNTHNLQIPFNIDVGNRAAKQVANIQFCSGCLQNGSRCWPMQVLAR